MKTKSLTRQASFLMAGRFFSMPLTFLVPMILVRYLSIDEFGIYKQLFLLFYLVLPIIDWGMSNSLFYFLPKYPELKRQILSQTFIVQVILCAVLVVCFTVFSNEITGLLKYEDGLSSYLPYIGFFAAIWHFSTILDVILIAENKAHISGVIVFLSESLKSILTIIAVVVFKGGVKEIILFSLIATGLFRVVLMSIYLKKTNFKPLFRIKKEYLRMQFAYAIPFGLAVIMTGFVGRSHQFIVTLGSSASEFAIYSVGCFQLPVLGIVTDSIAKTSLVRMTELTHSKGGLTEIALIISNSIRKLWMLFFPMFVFLFFNANDFVVLLFTENYSRSVPIFRVFIFMIPLSAILVQHVPRVFSETTFILKSNVARLVLTVIFCLFLNRLWGSLGVAIGFVMATVFWLMMFLTKCKKMLSVSLGSLIPVGAVASISLFSLLAGGVSQLIKSGFSCPLLLSFFISFASFWVVCVGLYWWCGVVSSDEKKMFINTAAQLLIRLKKCNGWFFLDDSRRGLGK